MCAAVLVALLVVFGGGCSALESYPTDPGGNLAVRTRMDSEVRAALHVHRVDWRCRTQYVGSVPLDAPSLALALPDGPASYLVLTFDTSSFLGGSRSTSVAMFVRPRAGRRYALAVRYHDSIYDVALAESDPSGRKERVLPRQGLEACAADAG